LAEVKKSSSDHKFCIFGKRRRVKRQRGLKIPVQESVCFPEAIITIMTLTQSHMK